MDVRLPDGTIITNVPEGITQKDLLERVTKMRAAPTPQLQAEQGGPLAKLGVSGLNFALGAASPFVGAAQGIAAAAGDTERAQQFGQNLETGMRQLRQSAYGAEGGAGFSPAAMAGTVLSPATLAAMKVLPPASTYGGQVLRGTGLGAAFGATTPVTSGNDFWSTKALQTGIGGVAGALIPGIVAPVGKALYNLIEPILPGGMQQVGGRVLNEAAGSRQGAVIQHLKADEKFVPGSQATAGEAATSAGSAEFAALQKMMTGRKPSEYAAIDEAQQAARLKAVQGVGQTKATLEAAQASRAAEAQANYKNAFNVILEEKLPESLTKNPYFKDAVPDAVKLAEAKGIDPKTNLTEFLHYVKLSLDKTLRKTGDTALSSTEKETVQGVKERLVNWLAQKNPAYEEARQAFAEASKPINQMQVGQYLESKLIPPLENTERAASFAQAMRDAPGTIKRATSGPRYDRLSQVLTPEQTTSLENVAAELQRKAQFDRLANKGMGAIRSQVGESLEPPNVPNFFMRSVMVAHHLLDRIKGGAEKMTLDELATVMQSPKLTAAWMDSANASQRKIVQAVLTDLGTVMAAQRSAKAVSTNEAGIIVPSAHIPPAFANQP